MSVAVVDVGTNSTRLLIAEVQDGRVTNELQRRTEVTRLGDGVDRTGRLSDSAIARVLAVCEAYRREIDRHAAERVVAVLTSAVRDAANGAEFEHTLTERFGFEAMTITGEREAWLTYRGATSVRRHESSVLVLDIGGGSTEFVVGAGDRLDFFVSTQVGSVRFTERYLRSDPPAADELAECRRAVHDEIDSAVPGDVRERTVEGIAVAGTPTSFAAIDQRLDPYDRDRVDGYVLSTDSVERILAELAALPVSARRAVVGLHPDRAPTIVAGGVILAETMRMFGMSGIEVSEHDILAGAALDAAEAAEIARKHA
jgi:exopolyphosphatase/guanosine-5'-triphosphate,3'-diphosphate pyrophosphatase